MTRRHLPSPSWRFAADRRVIALALVSAVAIAGRAWLAEHPQHDPWAPLDLRDPRGFATATKLSALASDPAECRAVLGRSAVAFTELLPTGEGECRREDRLVADDLPLSPPAAQATCAVAAGMTLWLAELQPMARELLGSDIARVEQLGTYNCRRINNAAQGRWSEHATGNAIDIAGFELADGQRISVLRDWNGQDAKGAFLHAARDLACASFGTVLSPDYNAAHADHLHLDQGRGVALGACR